MFATHRRDALANSFWEPKQGDLGSIEVWSYPDTHEITHYNFRRLQLQDADILNWLLQNDDFAPPAHPDGVEPTGEIRLLICERQGFKPVSFRMSLDNFFAVEKLFELPQETLPIFCSDSGRHAWQLRQTDGSPKPHYKLSLAMKLPQMYQLGNYGLALSHSSSTGTTLGILHGWNVLHSRNWEDNLRQKPPRSFLPHIERICDILKTTTDLWTHPLLLPVILMDEHARNAGMFKDADLIRRTGMIERRLGATRAGRNLNTRESRAEEIRALLSDPLIRFQTTIDINTATTDALSLDNVLKWDLRFCKCLKTIQNDIKQYLDPTTGMHQKMSESLATVEADITSVHEYASTIKSRLDIQLSVLYNLVAQAESSLSSTIAASTGLDSVAMKALAVVTTIFLPPTFIATLFSMSMFNWQGNSADGSKGSSPLVTSNFWIYWVVSVPLTIVVLVAWRLWWRRQKQYYSEKYPSTVSVEPEETGSRARLFSRIKGRVKHFQESNSEYSLGS